MGEISESKCGCTLLQEDNEGNGYIIAIAEYSKNNNLVLSYKTVCTKCKTWHEERDLILSEIQIEQYFGNKS